MSAVPGPSALSPFRFDAAVSAWIQAFFDSSVLWSKIAHMPVRGHRNSLPRKTNGVAVSGEVRAHI
jgi:hypothetical protein